MTIYLILIYMISYISNNSWAHGIENNPPDAPILESSAVSTPSTEGTLLTQNPSFEIGSGNMGGFAAAGMGGTVNYQLNLLGSSLGTGLLVGVPNFYFGYFWKYGLEFTITPSFNLLVPQQAYSDQPTDGSTLISRFSAGVTYNFSDNFRKSSYVRFDQGIGIFRSNGQSGNTYIFSLLYGRRFLLMPNISYTPTFNFEYMPGTAPNASLALTLTFLQISVFID